MSPIKKLKNYVLFLIQHSFIQPSRTLSRTALSMRDQSREMCSNLIGWMSWNAHHVSILLTASKRSRLMRGTVPQMKVRDCERRRAKEHKPPINKFFINFAQRINIMWFQSKVGLSPINIDSASFNTFSSTAPGWTI